ncbi:MAG: N-formylglutamate amidohydrolase [Flaviramulus sp.]|nr:N-formylglutamate amidohydrolase [Flaviramulus sp.]
MKLILTCEHGGNIIPEIFKPLFISNETALNSHRGFDIGALDIFKILNPLADYSKYSETTRLLIELNRSLHHKNLFSEFTKNISKKDKEALITSYYLCYRNQVENTINNWIENGEEVLHISVHSFTPILNNKKRNCDIGLLYDSKRDKEKVFCKKLKSKLNGLKNHLNVRYNYPYLGKADGFTTYLRKQFKSNYMGIEIEVNQKYTENNLMNPEIKTVLFLALKNTKS